MTVMPQVGLLRQRIAPPSCPQADPESRAEGPHPAGPGTQIPATRPDFQAHVGDAIDDRIAEILDELLEERNAARPHQRLPQVLGTVGFTLALITSVLLRHNAPGASPTVNQVETSNA